MGSSDVEDVELDLVQVIESQTDEQREDVAHAITGTAAGMLGISPIGVHHKIRVSNLFGELKETWRQTIEAITAKSREMNSPHRYRPDLRGSGMPRKRGKGQS